MADVIIRADHLYCGYRGAPIVRKVSFRLQRGESMLLIGHNGAGKSTLLKTLFGLLAPVGGRGAVCGVPLREGAGVEGVPEELMRRGARFLGQGHRAFDALTIGQQRVVLHRLYGMPPPLDAPRAQLFSTSRRVGALSGGQKRLEALRLLAAGKPDVFLLDEPVAGADAHNAGAIRDWIVERQRAGVSFVVAEHQFREFFGMIQRTMIIKRGEVTFEGRTADLQAKANLADLYL